MKNPLFFGQEWQASGKRVALATVVETWGSAPRPIGSHLVIDENGLFEGSVSGGCVEGAVVAEAQEVLATGKPKLLTFGVQDEAAWEVGLSCGGKISIYVQPCYDLTPLVTRLKARVGVTIVTNLNDGAHILKPIEGATKREENTFTNCYLPPLRFVITGAVHISQCLVPLARSIGLEPIIVDPRTAFATEERFANVTLLPSWTQDVLEQLALDKFTAFAALTHDPKIDDPAIEAAIRAGCFYIGALGSRKTHAKRVSRLQEKGFSEVEIARIKAPIGLDIGAISPQEIALSIMAEILQEARL